MFCEFKHFRSHVTTDNQSVSKSWFRGPSGSYDRILISVWHLLFYRCRAPLWREVGSVICSSHLKCFNSVILLLVFASYIGLPLVCLLHIEEAQALPPRQGSSPWGGTNISLVWFEVFTPVVLKSIFFWDTASYPRRRYSSFPSFDFQFKLPQDNKRALITLSW
jgi:hypothetical protein